MLRRKMLRDILKHKTQFISIFLMAFLAVFIYTGVGGEWRGLEENSEDFYNQTNLADVFVMGSDFSDEQLDSVSDIEGVTEIERRTVIEAVFEKSAEKPSILSLHFVEKNEVSKMYLIEGEEFNVDDETGIWLSKRFTDANNLKVGDKVDLHFSNIQFEREIKGIIYSSEYVFTEGNGTLTPNFKENGYAYLSHKAFPVPDGFVYNTLLIKTDVLSEFEDKLDSAIDGKYAVYFEQKDHPSVAMFNNETLQHRMMGDVFPVVFLAVALLTMMTTMTRIVTSQRVQIGTLKAMGFKKSKIMMHYVSYGFWLALLGSVAGCIVGPLTLPLLFYPSMSGFYTLPVWEPAYHFSFFIITALVVVLCTAITWFTCSKQLKDTPAATLRPKSPKISKHSFIEKTVLWQKVGFNTQWNLRDAMRNKIRSFMAVIGVLGCTALLVCAFGMNDSMEILKKWQYEDIYKFESKLLLEETVQSDRIDELLKEVQGEAVMESAIEIRVNDIKKGASALITDEVTLIQATDTNKRPISLPDGVSMTEKMASVLGVKIGDKIEWHIYGSEKWVESEVKALYRDPSSQGLTMTREVFEKLGYSFVPTSIVTAEKVIDKYDDVSAVLSTSEIISGWNEMTEAMMTMVFVLIVGAAILSIVVLYNLGLLSFTEMERDMATLKVMGMKTKKLRLLLLTQNIWFSIIGFVIGLPCGLMLIQVMTDASGDTFDFPVQLTFNTLICSFAITFGLSVFVSLLFSKKIKRLNMVESLKAIE